MVESSRGHQEEFEDDEEVTHKVKVDGKSREKNRSKHSETEQRRRSKINERFQILRDLIPQNDQKRDKASFLLELIEYVQFLQEKLNMYEGSYQGWSAEPTKLLPWRNQHAPTESFADHTQVVKNGSDLQNNVVSPSMPPNPQNSLESDMGSAMVYKTLDHFPGSATQSDPPNAQQITMLDSIGRCGVPSLALHESVSDEGDVDRLPQPLPESWQGGHTTVSSVLNHAPSIKEDKSGRVRTSNSYSQGVLDTLTQALQSSGVDLSQTRISVQINVANRTESGLTSMASSSKDHANRSLNSQVMSHTQVTSADDKFERAHKRLRINEK
ncbi:Basic helix-loop-helix transcription factor [Parasponia andersonii]|uniref:Basic helix-loop-helix transcription factor n=1 Tax=Parasponia andersonii TaxID=3476 RepID=A0A2P5B2D2_PARAD|nr:Basic helix-loop-helix transcription factor [Parasponia andersonii]